MLWLTWRQHRWQLIGVAAVAAAYWGFLIYAGIRAHRALDGCPGLASATALPRSCFDGANLVNALFNNGQYVLTFGNLLPLAVGAFWGAPLLAREYEQGTYRLAFTQSVSRRRWLASRLAVLAAAALLLGSVTGAIVSWSQAGFAPMYPTDPFGNGNTFSQSGFVPAAAWVFALLCGAAAGTAVRRVMTAVAVAVVALPLVFGALSVARPHYAAPVYDVVTGARMAPEFAQRHWGDGWLLERSYHDVAGDEVAYVTAREQCGDAPDPPADCFDRLGIRQRIVYHPADRYLRFQLTEVGLLLSASAAMTVFIYRRVTRT